MSTEILYAVVVSLCVFCIGYGLFRVQFKGNDLRGSLNNFLRQSPYSISTLFWLPLLLTVGGIVLFIVFVGEPNG